MPGAPFPSGRKLLLLLAVVVAGIGGVWWTRPARDPVIAGSRFSEWMHPPASPDPDAPPGNTEPFKTAKPEDVKWLAYTVEYGRHPFIKTKPLPFDQAPDWLRQLIPDRWGGLRVSATEDERLEAVQLLWMMARERAPEVVRAIPALDRSMDSDNENLLRSAAETLHNIGPAAWPAIQRALAHPHPKTRAAIVAAFPERITYLDENAPPPSDAELKNFAEALAAACRDPDAAVRAAAVEAIDDCAGDDRVDNSRFEVTIPALVALLSDTDVIRPYAFGALDQFRDKSAPAIPVLVGLLDSEDGNVVRSAASSLQHIGSPSWPVVERMLAEGKIRSRYALLAQMAARFEPSRHSRPVSASELAHIYEILIADLHNPDPQVRSLAAEALGSCHAAWVDGSIFEAAIPQLLSLLDEPDVPVTAALSVPVEGDLPIFGYSFHAAVIVALGDFGTQAVSAVPHLTHLLDNEDSRIRCYAAGALSKADVEEQHSAARLRAMRQDPDTLCRDAANFALTAFDHFKTEHPNPAPAAAR